VVIFEISLPKNWQKIGVFDSKQSSIIQKLIITLVFEKKNAIFCPKLAKIS
jgi:thioredoxin-related protein